MDVPARQAYVMAVVPPEERAAAASVTNVPRSLAAALPPLFTGAMLMHSTVGWPLVCGGVAEGAVRPPPADAVPVGAAARRGSLMTGALEVDRLTVDRGGRRVVNEVSFALAPGDIVTVVGPKADSQVLFDDFTVGQVP